MWTVTWIRVHFLELTYIITHYFYGCMTKKAYLASSETSLKPFLSFDVRMLILTIAVSIGFVQGSNKIVHTIFKLIKLCIGTNHCKKIQISKETPWTLKD